MNVSLLAFDALALGLLLQRLQELRLSKRHLQLLGPPDFGRSRPEPQLLCFHALFFAAPLLEVHLVDRALDWAWFLPAAFVLFAAQGVRLASQRALGRYWTVLPAAWRGQPEVTRGPYAYLRHPNYAAVVAEVLAFPAAGRAWWSLLLLNLLHPFVLGPRVRTERRALAEAFRSGN